jgi:2,3,4,5-tetrahydropyridine-2-carboxylate N-succinyltransferase
MHATQKHPIPVRPRDITPSWVELQAAVELAWASHTKGRRSSANDEVVELVKAELEAGHVRLAEKNSAGEWVLNEWVRKAILFMQGAELVRSYAGPLSFNDSAGACRDCADMPGARVMAPSVVRRGSYIAPGAIVVASFIGNGCHVGKGSLVDGFANLGSGAQVGDHVHISTSACLGGIIEPAQRRPVIIEDNCFIGANASIVEGVLVEEGSVIGMGVQLGASTKIFDRATGQVSYGRIPKGSVVVPGSLPSACGTYATSAAIIIKQVDAAVRAKTAINDLLRG